MTPGAARSLPGAPGAPGARPGRCCCSCWSCGRRGLCRERAAIEPRPPGPRRAGRAAALAEPPVAITVNGTCPNAEAIWAAVASIVPAKDLDRFAAAARVEISDLGDSYRVSVNAKGIDRLRVYRDLAHDCDHRARFAAVFVVLTLMPPDVLLDALPAQPATRTTPTRRRRDPPGREPVRPTRRHRPGRA